MLHHLNFFFVQITTEFTKEVESVCVKRPKWRYLHKYYVYPWAIAHFAQSEKDTRIGYTDLFDYNSGKI